MNKTHRCANWLRTSIRVKCKNKFTIKKVLFSTDQEPHPYKNGIQSRFDPMHGCKTVDLSWQRSVDSGDCEQRELSRVTFRTRSKTADVLPIHITINTSHNEVPAFQTLDQDRSWLTNSRHTTLPCR